ncbi:alpha/beta hydrolase [Kitasatospora sp. NBC_01560]|uniref:alpha/beta hydrolase n=1 Tax=Kitasatospora sp. NBC_01560 TaxID=2975965 RepID=UPI00386D2631
MDLAVALTRTALNAGSLVAPGLAGRASFFLFCNPLQRSRVREVERDVHRKAVVEELTVAGKKVVTYRWGDGRRPVLMLHGWQSRASRYAAFVPRLEALGLSPVSFDAPGHGDSGGKATTILEYREIIGLLQERYGAFHSVIAHSFGVACAFLALRGGVKAERLVAVSGVSDFQFLLDAFCEQLNLNGRLRADLKRRIEQQLFPSTPDLWELFDAKVHTEQITLPILLIHDEDDPTVGIDEAYQLRDAYPGQAQLLVTQRLGHRKILGENAVLDNALGFLAPADGVPGEPAGEVSSPA